MDVNQNTIIGKSPFDFMIQLQTWNYHYNEKTNQFYKYVGMGMMVLGSDWNLLFVVRNDKASLLIHSGEEIKESIAEIPCAEALVFASYTELRNPLMLHLPMLATLKHEQSI